MASGYTRKQVVACLSIVYLILVTALAAYASSGARRLSLPIPDILSGFATALPIVAGLLLEGGYDLSRLQERRRHLPKGQTPRPPLVLIANTLIFIYSTVVVTLLGTHIGPASEVRCRLDQRWRALFTHKNREAIRTIQEALDCCGFVNSHDQAWPFPDKDHDVHSCEKEFGRNTGCLGPWKHEEQRMAGVLIAVVGLVFVWQMAIIVFPIPRGSWMNRVVPDRVSNLVAGDEGGPDRPRRAIGYLPTAGRYRDSIAEEVEDEETAETAPRRAIEEGVNGNAEQEQQIPAIQNVWTRD